MPTRRTLLGVMTGLTTMMIAACGSDAAQPPIAPTPPPAERAIAIAYILPGATTLGSNAFGDEPVVIYKEERLRWFNLDSSTHALVADTPGVPDFDKTNTLAPGGEQSFIMTKTGRTTFHCAIHPDMVGTLVVRER